MAQISLAVRRLHDRGHSGFWMFVCVVPALNLLMFLYLLFAEASPVRMSMEWPNKKLLTGIPLLLYYTSFLLEKATDKRFLNNEMFQLKH